MKEKRSINTVEIIKWVLAILLGAAIAIQIFIKIECITKPADIVKIVDDSFELGSIRRSSKESENTININTFINNEVDFLRGIKHTIYKMQDKNISLSKKHKNKKFVLITGQFVDTIEEKSDIGVNLQIDKIDFYDIDFKTMSELREMLNKYNEY